MHVEEQDRSITPEHLLRPVSVMNIPVDDKDALDVVLALRISRADRNVVEHAKAHPAGL